MHFEYSDPALDGFFRLTEDPAASINSVSQKLKLIHILWNHGKENVEFIMDGAKITLQPEHLTTVTYLQRTEFSRLSPQLITYSFNREFYCIHDHDHEVSCNGIIFFGSQ
ncbi:MAG: hypothetical protein KI790_15930, partial [Cyclobacteriaceae bacterium]|nr:hypothetical protein [Cyclobacteriaceae bacterium HetDA_MAG_MS6]